MSIQEVMTKYCHIASLDWSGGVEDNKFCSDDISQSYAVKAKKYVIVDYLRFRDIRELEYSK